MGEIVSFASNGRACSGYLAVPDSGTGPGVVVIQEWWGLVPHIESVADRLAGEGFVALAPDLYQGERTAEPDEAGKLMMQVDIERAARDMTDAVDYLTSHPAVHGQGIGVIGFCMGGGLALWLSCLAPEVKAAVPFYGVAGWPDVEPDFTKSPAAYLGHYAEHDEWAGPDVAVALEERLRGLGKEATFHVYPGTQHAFFNDDRPGSHDLAAADLAWERTLAFLHRHLDPD
jgi:carboxymethylenebutenolidase